MGIAFIPIIIKNLGVEAYGLIGVYAMLQMWFSLLDMGMTPTLGREMARYTSGAHTAKSIRDLLRSLEVVCFIAALLIGFVIWLSSNWLATNWLQLDKLSVADVSHAISIIALVVAMRFIEGLYRGALVGLQRQVSLNMVSAVMATLRWGGVVCILIWVAPSLEAFFIWQALVSVATTLIFIFILYSNLPGKNKSGNFSWIELKRIKMFAGGMMMQTLLTLMLTQIDKIMLSRFLSLEMFGYYTLAATFANILIQMVSPITLAHLPRFTELVTKGDSQLLIKLYHQAAQLVSVLISTGAFIFIYFGADIILIWGGDTQLANNVSPILALLALGTMLNGLMHIPYMLTLAYGWAGFFVRVNVVAVIILVPVIFWIAPIYGAIGVSWVWIILNIGYLLIAARFMYKKVMQTEMWRWYWCDIIKPITTAFLIATTLELINPSFSTIIHDLLWLLLSGLCILLGSALSAPTLRKGVINLASFKPRGNIVQ